MPLRDFFDLFATVSSSVLVSGDGIREFRALVRVAVTGRYAEAIQSLEALLYGWPESGFFFKAKLVQGRACIRFDYSGHGESGGRETSIVEYRELASRLHAIIEATAPDLWPKTWYGMPAWAKDGKVVCFFQSAEKFSARYATLGFSDQAILQINLIASWFNYINRVAEGVGIEDEPEWGQPGA